ncbi:hypothetical protein FRC00_008107 [Tulasnella sp. 408]|nr:hypothetical protein FRC00_008107 [Tulasnella sp. 408]
MSDIDRFSQAPSTVRKGARAPPAYRNDANFGRASGKIINIGTVARDSDGFEDFGAYLNDDVFLSPPPSIPSKPKPKTQPKKSIGSTRRATDSDDDATILDESVLGRRAEPEPPKKSSQTRTVVVAATTTTSRQNRPATQTTSAVDYDSIPEPSTKRKTLSQSTSSKPASSSRNSRPSTTTTARPSTSSSSRTVPPTTKSNTKGKQPAALTTIQEDEDDDDVDDQDGNGDSNMSIASLVDENQGAESHAGRFNQDDDDSGNEDFGFAGDDNDGGMDVDEPERDPTPEPVQSKANDKARRNRVETPSDEEMVGSGVGMDDEDMPAPDNDDEFDVGGGYDDEPQQEEEEEEREPSESPRSKRARLAQEKKEKQKQKREPLRQKDPNAQPKKTKQVFEPREDFRLLSRPHTQFLIYDSVIESDDDDDDGPGPRRGKRQRYAPLQWWRGEHAVVRRPRAGEAPVPIISEIVRIPQERPEPLSKKHRRRGTTKPPSSRGNQKQQEVYVDNPEDGWDAETDQNAMVIDYDTKQEIEKGAPRKFSSELLEILISLDFVFTAIAQTAAMLNPKQPLNASYAFQKVFSDGEFVAGGVLEIPVGGKKPSKPARDNTYLFYCIEGAVRVMVHRSTFVIARNGMFMVPRGNQYYLENISDHSCKLFFAQARKVTEKMIPSPTKRASMVPAAREASASQTPKPAARGLPATSGSPSKTKKGVTGSKR